MKQIFLIVVLAVIATCSANKCITERDGVHFPISGDCGKFIVCDRQVEAIKSCPTGLHFSPRLLYCMLPAEAECETTPPPTKPPTRPPTLPPTRPPTKPPTPSYSCKGQPLGKRIPYEGVCEKFIVCIGTGTVMNCPDQTHFNAVLEVCDHPQSANCPWW